MMHTTGSEEAVTQNSKGRGLKERLGVEVVQVGEKILCVVTGLSPELLDFLANDEHLGFYEHHDATLRRRTILTALFSQATKEEIALGWRRGIYPGKRAALTKHLHLEVPPTNGPDLNAVYTPSLHLCDLWTDGSRLFFPSLSCPSPVSTHPPVQEAMSSFLSLCHHYAHPQGLEGVELEEGVYNTYISEELRSHLPDFYEATQTEVQRLMDEDKRFCLEFSNLMRKFEWYKRIFRGAFTASQVAGLLGTSRQTPLDRLSAGHYLALDFGGKKMFPFWQFDPEGTYGLVPGFSRVLKALHGTGEKSLWGEDAENAGQMSPLEKATFFLRKSPYLNGRTPLEALKERDEDQVVDIANGVRSS